MGPSGWAFLGPEHKCSSAFQDQGDLQKQERFRQEMAKKYISVTLSQPEVRSQDCQSISKVLQSLHLSFSHLSDITQALGNAVIWR